MTCWTSTLEDRTSQQDFDDFMNKHGEFFPENPRNVDELLDSLAQRAAAAQRFRNSLSPDQRAELDALAQQAFGSPSLMNALNRLDGHLQAARPGEDWNGSSRFSGDNPMGMGEGTQALADIAELEQLAEAAVAELCRRDDGRRRPRGACPPARRGGGGRRTHAHRTGAGAGQPGLPGPRIRRAMAAVSQGHAPARPDRIARCGRTAFGQTRGTRYPAGRGGRRADGCDAAMAVRRHRAVERHPHIDECRSAASGYGCDGDALFISPSTMSRYPRPRPARRPRWRCWWTPRSRW